MKIKTVRIECLILPVVLGMHASLHAQQGEPRDEIWVDGPEAVKPGGDVRNPDVAVDAKGRAIYVWASSAGISGLEVFVRRFGVDDTPLSDPVQVNTLTQDSQLYPRVAAADDGSFLVIWQSLEPPSPGDTFERNVIRSQAYDAAGRPVGTEQRLSTLQTLIATDVRADVAALAGGGYVAVWQSAQSDGTDTDRNIQARLVGADGRPAGAQFQVNSETASTQRSPAVTGLADGGFMAAWVGPEIHGRRFDAAGLPRGDDFQINTLDTNVTRDDVDLATNAVDGRVLAVWSDPEDRANDTEIRARLFDADLVPEGPDFRVNVSLAGRQDAPRVAGYDRGGFLVFWQTDRGFDSDAEPNGIVGRQVSGSDRFASSPFLVNQWVMNSQSNPTASGSNGRVAAAWRSQSNSETTANVIQARNWSLCGIFCDGFE